MNIVFCQTCKGRVQHLARTLPANLADNRKAKFVVLNYNDQDGLMDYLKANHAKDIIGGRLAVYHYRGDGPFQMAHAKNMAHRLGIMEGADILVNLDADNFTGPGFDSYVAERFDGRDDVFLWSRMIKDGDGRLPRGISGRIAMTARAFVLAGGYDEIYKTHSPDDKDANARLRRLGFDAVEIEPRFLKAILHNDKMRYKDYPEAADSDAEDFYIYREGTVANKGIVGCGTVFKNFTDEPIEIGPIPTRVFGIGCHKTATTSLHKAFKILGYKSAHWPSAHWAKAVWREMIQTGRSPTLERYYAACDLPIPLLYRQLDAAYPGSKFILTMRDDARWLESARKHFSYDWNRFRAQWDSDPFSHRIHKIIYGRTDFEPVTFLDRYQRHNAEVLEYFRSRPDDLLVMDMDRNCGWEQLCQFLKLPIPAEPYPVAGASKQA